MDDDFAVLRDLPDKAVVQDRNGQVWCVQKHPRFGNEIWLSPFSDEYSFILRPDDSYHALGNMPRPPFTDLGIVDSVGG